MRPRLRRQLTVAALTAAGLSLAAAVPPAAAALRIDHSQGDVARNAQFVVVRAQLLGSHTQEPEMTLFYSVDGDSFTSMDLYRRGASSYVARIPAATTDGLELHYYLVGRSGTEVSAIGSADKPLRVALETQPMQAGMVGAAVGLALLLFGGELLVGLWSGQLEGGSRRPRAFWTRTLAPVPSLDGPALGHTLDRLSRVPIEHPIHAHRRFDRHQLASRVVAPRSDHRQG